MAKQIMFDDAARQKMKAGIEKLAKTVRVTLGPAGRNVILQKSFGSPHVTKDGVSVAKEIVASKGVAGLYTGTLFKASYLGAGMAGAIVLIPIFSEMMGIEYAMA